MARSTALPQRRELWGVWCATQRRLASPVPPEARRSRGEEGCSGASYFRGFRSKRARRDSTRLWNPSGLRGRLSSRIPTHSRCGRVSFRVGCGSPSGMVSGTCSQVTPSRSTARCLTLSATAGKGPRTGWRAARPAGNDERSLARFRTAAFSGLGMSGVGRYAEFCIATRCRRTILRPASELELGATALSARGSRPGHPQRPHTSR